MLPRSPDEERQTPTELQKKLPSTIQKHDPQLIVVLLNPGSCSFWGLFGLALGCLRLFKAVWESIIRAPPELNERGGASEASGAVRGRRERAERATGARARTATRLARSANLSEAKPGWGVGA